MTTQCAVITPPGRGGIAVMGIVGSEAWEVTRKLFRPRSGSLPVVPTQGWRKVGLFGADVRDEVVALVREAEPVPSIEIQTHGSPEVLRGLRRELANLGVETVDGWQLWARGDSRQADLGKALANALTSRVASILLAQQQGAFAQALRRLVCDLDQKLAAVGASANAKSVYAADTIVSSSLFRFRELGEHLTSPWKVLVAGAPNAGKSSLVNAMAGFERSIVAPTPGTTRDVVSVTLALDGWPVELQDSAGLRHAPDELEALGQAKAMEAASQADLVLWLADGSTAAAWPNAADPKTRFVVTKTDLPAGWDYENRLDLTRISAKTGAGLSELGDQIARWLVPIAPAIDDGLPFSPEWCKLLYRVEQLAQAGRWSEARELLS